MQRRHQLPILAVEHEVTSVHGIRVTGKKEALGEGTFPVSLFVHHKPHMEWPRIRQENAE
jgi:hypothetical protein